MMGGGAQEETALLRPSWGCDPLWGNEIASERGYIVKPLSAEADRPPCPFLAFSHSLCPASSQSQMSWSGKPQQAQTTGWAFKTLFTSKPLSETQFCTGVGGGIDLHSSCYPFPRQEKPGCLPSEGMQAGDQGEITEGALGLSAHPRREDLGHSNGRSKFGDPASLHPQRVRRT